MDRLLLSLRLPSDPPEDLGRAQPYTVVLVQEHLHKSGDGRSAGPRQEIDRFEPEGIVRVAESPDERAGGHIPDADEQVPGHLPDLGVIAPERSDKRLDGRLAHRRQDLRRNLPGTGATEHRDERNGGRPPDPGQHPGGCLREPILIQGTDQGFDGRGPDLHQRIPRRPAEFLFTEQADQWRNRRRSDPGKRRRCSCLHARILIAEPCRQEVDGRLPEAHNILPALQRDQVPCLFFHPRGHPAKPPEDDGSPHAGPCVLIIKRPNERFTCVVADPGERGHRSRVPVALLTEEGDEGRYRRCPDADKRVDGLPVEAVATTPDKVDDGRDRLMRPKPAQHLDGVLPGGTFFFEQPEDRGYGSLPDGDKRIRRRRGDTLVREGVHERPHSRRVTDLAERPRGLAAYAVVVAVECPDQRSDGRCAHQGKFHPLFMGNQVPRPLSIAPGFPAHPLKDPGSMTPDRGPIFRQRLDQGRDRRLPDRNQDLPE